MKYLKEIVDTGSFVKAAESLFISQPALSKAIKRLEKKLGFDIFKKVGTRNVLTLQGKEVIKYIDPVLKQYSEFEKQLKNLSSKSHIVNYGVIPYYCTPFTTMFLFNFKEKFPHITVNMIEAPQEVLLEKLLKGDIDVAMTQSLIDSGKVEIYSGFQDDVSVAVGENSPLYDKESLSFADLRDYSFNFVTNSDVLRKQVFDGCTKASFEPSIGYQSSQIGLLLENTKLTKNICVLNRPMIYDNIAVNPSLEGVKIIPLEPSPQCFCYVYHRKGRKLTGDIENFLEEITNDLTVDTRERII